MNRIPGPCLDLKSVFVFEQAIIRAGGSLDQISRQILTDEIYARRLAEMSIAEFEKRQGERRDQLTEIGRQNTAIQNTKED